jgi:thymidine phosphorylase
LEARLKDESAWKKFVSLVYALDGDATALGKITDMQLASIIHPLPTKKSGTIKKMDAKQSKRRWKRMSRCCFCTRASSNPCARFCRL